ncbi:MAG: hypothetical protein IPL28_11390 [Chloroflexi bacterium]|nr:hypothetical protein [Chloroflexota bacterium]
MSITLLDNTRIFLNHAADNGGGIYAADDVSLLLDEVSFVGDNGPTWGNTADMGAGIYADGVIVRLQGIRECNTTRPLTLAVAYSWWVEANCT